MNGIDAAQFVQQRILGRSLTDVEEAIFMGAWSGKRYDEIAKQIGYDTGYIKEMGSKLWSILSREIRYKVTKKTLRLVIEKHQRRIESPNASVQENYVLEGGTVHRLSRSFSKNLTHEPLSASQRFPNGAISAQFPGYIHRSGIEDVIINELNQPGGFVHLYSPRRFGKTSLLNSVSSRFSQLGFYRILISFSQFEEALLEDVGLFLKCFLLNLLRQLELDADLGRDWLTGAGIKNNITEALEVRVLSELESPVLLVLDDLEAVYRIPTVAQEFLSLLQDWQVRSLRDSCWGKLRLLSARSVSPISSCPLQMSSISLSPDFGLHIELPAFTQTEAEILAQRYDLFSIGLEATEFEALYQTVGGHPYLLQISFSGLQRKLFLPEGLVKQVTASNSLCVAYLLGLWQELDRCFELKNALFQVLNTSEPVLLPLPIAYQLEKIGLVQFAGDRVKIRCELYQHYFSRCFAQAP